MKKILSLILAQSLLWASGPAQAFAASMAEGPAHLPSSARPPVGGLATPNLGTLPAGSLDSSPIGKTPVSLPASAIPGFLSGPAAMAPSSADAPLAETEPGRAAPEPKTIGVALSRAPAQKPSNAAAAARPNTGHTALSLLEGFRDLLPSGTYALAQRLMDGSRGSKADGEAVLSRRGEGRLSPPGLSASRDRASLNYAFRLWRPFLRPIFKAMYSVTARGLENIPKKGGALLIMNHVVYMVEVALISILVDRPVIFLIHRPYYENPRIHWFLKQFKAIPLTPSANPNALDEEKARIKLAQEKELDQAREAANNGNLVAIFPEGTLTPDGMLHQFRRRGIETLAKGLKVPVVPICSAGLWGSFLSRKLRKSLWKYLIGLPRRVVIHVGPPLGQVNVEKAKAAVEALSPDARAELVRRLKKTLPLAFLDAAKKFWRREAVADSSAKSLTYGWALASSVLLAGALQAPLAAQMNVGILLAPSVGGVLANTALQIGGKVAVNLNTLASEEELAISLKKVEVQSIITSRRVLDALRSKAQSDPGFHYFWDKYKDRFIYIENYFEGDPEVRIPKWKLACTYGALRVLPRWAIRALYFGHAERSLDKTAAILFTSGTSGDPKGVELSHFNLQAEMEMLSDVYSLSPQDKILGVLPFFHSFGFTITLWEPLFMGNFTVYHYHPLDVEGIARLAESHRPTVLFAMPSFLSRYLEHIPGLKQAFSALKIVITGAESLPDTTAKRFEDTFGVRPRSGYGMTELSPVATVNPPDGLGPHGSKVLGDRPGTVGLPLPGVQVKIVNPDTFKELPIGQEGMLLVRGPNVMKGYYNDPEATAKTMHDGFLVTGDIAFIDKEGYVTIVGRLSRFSKIMGEKISHDVLERKLHEAAASDGHVFVVTGIPERRPGKKNAERLVVLYAGYRGDIRELIDGVKQRGFKRAPDEDSFFAVEKIPVLGNGKVNYREVKRLAQELAQSGN